MVIGGQRRVVESLGADAEDDRAARVRLQGRARGERLLAEVDLRLAGDDLIEPSSRETVASSMLIAGLPMKPATNMFCGRS